MKGRSKRVPTKDPGKKKVKPEVQKKPQKFQDWQDEARLAKFEPVRYDGPRCSYCGGEISNKVCANQGPDYPHPPQQEN